MQNSIARHPAKAMGIENEVGAIEAGKRADLIIVEEMSGIPVVMKAMVGGRVVYNARYSTAENSVCAGRLTETEAA
jgi:alpha-D-ribose 1-methylphosphonate 5-triphosphate diphosphatase